MNERNVRIISNGEYYLFKGKSRRNIFMVKYYYNSNKIGAVPCGIIKFPIELIGKKIRFKIEVLNEQNI